MNVFSITKAKRGIGYNYGLPCWLVEFGPGNSYTPEELIAHLINRGLQPKQLIVLQKGMSQKGLGKLVSLFSHVGCRIEVEASGSDATPGWFTSVDTWTIYWNGSNTFHFNALRAGRDLIITDDIPATIEVLGAPERVEWGTKLDLSVEDKALWACRLRSYPGELKE